MTNSASSVFSVSSLPGTAVGAELTFSTIQQAVDYAVSLSPSVNSIQRYTIRVAIGDYSAQAIVLPELFAWVIVGDQSGATRIGDITWACSGGQTPPQPPQSILILRDITTNSVTINDGVAPATVATFVMQNAQVLTTITATGTSNCDCILGGLTAANSTILVGRVSTKIVGNMSVPHCNIAATKVLFQSGTISCNQLFAHACSITGNITISQAASELIDCVFGAPLSTTFSGSPGIFKLDGVTNFNFLNSGVTVVNGSTLLTEAPIFSSSKSAIAVSSANIVLTPLQYNTELIIVSGTLTANVTLTFPIGVWFVDTSAVVFAGHTLSIVNGAHTTNLPQLQSTFVVSITSTKVTVVPGLDNLQQTSVIEVTADTTTASTTFVDLDSVTTTITTIAGSKLILSFTCSASNSNTNHGMSFRFVVDGAAGRGASAFYNNVPQSVSLSQKVTGLAAGAHTVKMQWLTAANTLQIRPVTVPNTEHACMTVMEVMT